RLGVLAVHPSQHRAAADFFRNLARQELAVLEIAAEHAVLDHDLAAQHGERGPRIDLVTLPRRVIRLVQHLLAYGRRERRIEHSDVGIAAGRERTLLRIESHDLRRIRGNAVDEFLQRVAAPADHLRVHERHARLDTDVAAGGVVYAIALRLHLE